MKKIAAVFPGQGSQSVGMGKELFENFKTYRETLEEASDTLGFSFEKLCFEGPSETLMLTENTQPAILAASTAAFRVLKKDLDFKPSCGAGHSVGEYAALVACEVLNFSDALKAVKLRGKSMQAAVPLGQGAMAALMGPSPEQVVEVCKWVESQNSDWVCEAANFNAPGQVVVSGSADALNWLKENLSSFELKPQPRKVRLIPLKVSAPFHCKLMLPAQKEMASFFEEISFESPQFDFYQNTTAQKENDSKEIKENLIKQVSGSVMWAQSVENILEQKQEAFVEVGSGTVLSGLIKKIGSHDCDLHNTNTLEGLKKFESYLQ